MTPNDRCEAFAAKRHWIVSRNQALRLGMKRGAIDRRLANGRWRKVYPGVYTVGQARLSPRSRLLAATIWGGEGAVASFTSAGHLFGLVSEREGAVEITTRHKKNSAHGVTTHFDTNLSKKPKVYIDGIPVTSPPRTLLDLCATSAEERSVEVVRRALKAELTTVDRVARFLISESRSGRPGVRRLRRILRDRFGHGVTDSEAEDLFMELAPRYGLFPVHHHVVRLEGKDVEFDFFLPPRLDVEVDGSGVHSNPVQYDSDRARDELLELNGYDVVRCSYWQLVNDPDRVFARIKAKRRKD